MTEEVSIRVNFSKPMPLFPLDPVALLPQQVIPLHIFEPRYRQMIDVALDGPGQIAMGTFAGDSWKQTYHGTPPVKPAVCVGQIVQHEHLDDGRYNILLQGVCRARIIGELPPDEDRQYRLVNLRPVGVELEADEETDMLRDWLSEHLAEEPLSRLTTAPEILKLVDNAQVPAAVLLEIVSFVLVNDDRTRYALLAEGDTGRRSRMVRASLTDLESLIHKAVAQRADQWPKGCSWN